MSQKAPSWIKTPAILAGLFLVLPAVYLIVRAAGFSGSYSEIIFTKRTGSILLNSIYLASATGFLCTLLGLPIAWFCQRANLPMRRLLFVLAVLPLAIPSYISAYAIVAIFGHGGLWHSLFESQFPFEVYGFNGALLSMTMVNFPLSILIINAAIQRMDPALEEAARSLGSSPWKVFTSICLPQLMPAAKAAAILTALYTLSDFGTPALMRYDTLTLAIFTEYDTADLDRAAIYALLLIVATFILLYLEGILQKQGKLYSRNSGGKKAKRSHNSLFNTVAFFFIVAVVCVAFFLPVGAIAYWFFNATDSLSWQDVQDPLLNSSYAGALAAFFISLAALPLSLIAVRYPSRLSRILQKCVFTGNSIPGIVTALALVACFASWRTQFFDIYQTIPLLILAYGIRFMPQAFSSQHSSLLQVNPRLEEASLSLGASHFKTIRLVLFPLIKPGFFASLALIFIATVKELPITLLLSPPGYECLPQVIWRHADEGEYSLVALPALLLIGISALSLIFILKQEDKKNA